MSANALYAFGDQSLRSLSSIQHLSRQSLELVFLKQFLQAAANIIQSALRNVPAHIRPDVLPITSLVQLAESVNKDPTFTPLASALLTITQLGDFIVHLSSKPDALDGSHDRPVFVGLCTGSLAAAAIASSRNLTELLEIGPHVVSLSFNIGLEALKRSRSLDISSGSWATVIKDVSPEEAQVAIEEFNHTLNDRSHSRMYISAVGDSSVTVSGPPTISQRFFDGRSKLSGLRRVQLPVHSAFHARHLVPVPHSRIFESVGMHLFKRNTSHLLLSPCSGTHYNSRRLDLVLQEMIGEILQQPMNWRNVTNELARLLLPSASALTMGPFAGTSALSRWMPQTDKETWSKSEYNSCNPQHGNAGGVAIVGMSIRAPGSESLEEFWDTLKEGKDLHRRIPADRFDVDRCDEQSRKRSRGKTPPYGVFLDRPGHFDPKFFNMSPREALQTDPQQRLMLLTTYEALENAGYRPNRTPSYNTRRIATFMGQTGDDYRESNASQDIDTHFITGNIRAFGPGRLNYHFGWEGPSYSVDTACSSSGASIQLACSSLLSRECDTAVCGGANLLTSPDLFTGLAQGGFLSRTGECKTFDKNADGYVRGEACGVLVLKRLEDACQEQDSILAVIRGATTNHSAEAISITHPHQETQERLFRSVLNSAGVLPHEVDLAEIHGTGTQAGDNVESRSITNVLCEGRSLQNPLVLSTVKPNVGHSEAASGVTSVIKAVLMMQKNTIPPHIGIKGRINDKLPHFGQLNVRLCDEETSFVHRGNKTCKRRILVNNFDAAGGNTSMLLEDPPHMRPRDHDQRSHKVVTFSAKSATSLTNNIDRVLSWLRRSPEIRIEDLAYTTTARRMHYPYRKAYTATSLEQLTTNLEHERSSEITRQTCGLPSTIFCFTGQGSHYPSMALSLYETHPTFRNLIDDYASICDSLGFPSFIPVLQGDSAASACPVRIQLALVAIELALSLLWHSWGIKATAVIGHSLGEYAALCYAKVISVHDCFYLVGKRAQLILSSCAKDAFAMLAVQGPREKVKECLTKLSSEGVEFACFNSPTSSVLSGSRLEIERLRDLLESNGLRSTILSTRHAFHSSRMDVILDDFENIARIVNFKEPCIPVSSTLLGEVVTKKGVFSAQYLRSQTRGVVQFEAAIHALSDASITDKDTVWIEVGPASTCTGMVKATVAKARAIVPSLQKGKQDWQTLSSSVAAAYVAGLNIDWTEFHRPFENRLQLVSPPNYSFDLKNYWMTGEHTALSKTSHQHVKSEDMSPASPTDFIPTTCLHRIEKNDSDANMISLTFTADVSTPSFDRILRGHSVNGVALCSSSVYTEMALTAASHIQKLLKSNQQLRMEVDDMTITKPLILGPKGTQQAILVTARKQTSSPEVKIQFGSRNGSACQMHAACTVRFVSKERPLTPLSNGSRSIRTKINDLHQASAHGKAHRILRPMVYKLFRNFVKYDRDYQGLEEVFLDTDMLEATANVTLRDTEGLFTCNPHWIDSIAHLSGFILNGSEFTPDESVFISHGWKSFKILDSLSTTKTYQSYVRMEPQECPTIFGGDVYVYDGNNIVAICQGLQFQQVKRKSLDHIFACASQSYTASTVVVGKPESPPHMDKAVCVDVLNPPEALSHTTSYFDYEPVLAIIAAELGVDLCDLDEDADFHHLGIDSLMTTSILTTIAAQLDLVLPVTTFIECRTIKELRAHLTTAADCLPASIIHDSDNPELPKDMWLPGSMFTETCVNFHQVLTVVAKELDVAVSELHDDTRFADLGVDSLLTISILTSLGELLKAQLPASLFIECHSVAALRLYLESSGYCQNMNVPDLVHGIGDSVSEDSTLDPVTPIAETGRYCDETGFDSMVERTKMIRKLTAEDVDYGTEEFEDGSVLVDGSWEHGLPLKASTVACEHPEPKIDLPELPDCGTLSTINHASPVAPQLRCVTDAIYSQQSPQEVSSQTQSAATLASRNMGTNTWSASAILLQDSPSRTEPGLFLIPDGSGSSMSYVRLPHLNHQGAVYGLNSPFLSRPDEFNIPLEEVAALYVKEMQRIQPQGPYNIGGWSFGGICAFEAASQLIRRHGQEISSLVLIDAPCPTIFPPLPIKDIDFLQSVGAFETLKSNSKREACARVDESALELRDGMREHFAGSISALGQYQARAIDHANAPQCVTVLWARHGVWETLGDEMEVYRAGGSKQDRHPTTRWVMDTRSDYETCGWEKLLPTSNFTCHTVEGDHFSIMSKPGVVEMGAKISSSLCRA